MNYEYMEISLAAARRFASVIKPAALPLVIPEKDVPEFKRLLVAYYEDRDIGERVGFMKNKCWKNQYKYNKPEQKASDIHQTKDLKI